MAGTNCELDVRQDSNYDMKVNRNRTLDQTFDAYFTSGTTEYEFDFTPYSGASLQVRKKYDSAYVILEVSTDDGSIVLGVDGQFTLTKTAEELENVRAAENIYDMYISSASAAKRAFLSGKFTITDRVTI